MAPNQKSETKLFGVIPVVPISPEKKKRLLLVTCLIGITATNLSGGITLAEIAAVSAIAIASMPETRQVNK